MQLERLAVELDLIIGNGELGFDGAVFAGDVAVLNHGFQAFAGEQADGVVHFFLLLYAVGVFHGKQDFYISEFAREGVHKVHGLNTVFRGH